MIDPNLVDVKQLQAELQELAGTVKVRVHVRHRRNGKCAVGVRETDMRVDVFLDPRRIKDQEDLESRLAWLRGWFS